MEDCNFQTFKADIKQKIETGGHIFPFGLSDDFLNWFVEKGKFFEHSHVSIPNNFIVTNSTPGNCFHNSQLVCMQNDGVSYFEGIMMGHTNKSIIHHGFNLLKEKILDVSFINNKSNFIDILKDETFNYFGVEIDIDYINKFPEILRFKYYNNYIVLKYYEDSLSA